QDARKRHAIDQCPKDDRTRRLQGRQEVESQRLRAVEVVGDQLLHGSQVELQLEAQGFTQPGCSVPVKVGGKLGKAARELANLALHQRDQNQQQRQYQQQNDKDHEQSANRARHTMAFRPRHERAAEIREDRADQKRLQIRPEETQQRRVHDRGGGVDIDAGEALVEAIKPFAKRTLRPEVLAGIGGFGALVELPKRYREPVLVAGTDGVGTKLKLAFALNRHDTIGTDLVAMSVNDILVQGAEPLFFLDYYVCERLDLAVARDVIKGIAAGCEQAGCALIGGETAEHPDAFVPGEYDLAGFAVGVVEKGRAIDGRGIVEG